MGRVAAEVTHARSIRHLIETEIVSRLDEWYEDCAPHIPGFVARFGERQLIGLGLEAGLAESRSSRRSALLYAREMGRLKCLTLSGLLAVQGFHALAPLARFAGSTVRRTVLESAVSGRAIMARQVVEHGTRRGLVLARSVGSGDFAISARALRVPNAQYAHWLCLECKSPQTLPDAGRGFVLVPVDAAGVAMSVEALPGGRTVARVDLREVRVPRDHVFHAPSLAADTELHDFERLVAAAFYLSRCEEILAIAADCLRARSASPALAARAWLGAARLAELHSEAAAAGALLERAAVETTSQQVALARYRVAELAAAVSRASGLWWKDRSGRRAHPVLQLCDDMIEAPLDGVTPAGLLGEITRDLGCGLRVRPAQPAGAVTPARTHAPR